MRIYLLGIPNSKQKLFFQSKARHIGYGGARGGGKSWAMRRCLVRLALRYPNLKLLLLRRTITELRENHTLALLNELHGIADYTETERAFTFPNGSRIKLGYCALEKDVLQYQGQEYDVIGMEEATHFTEYQRTFLTTCNRTTRTDFTPRMYYTANPGGTGHAWFKRLFIDRDYQGSEQPEDYEFIPAKIYDNPTLMRSNPEYLRTLQNLPPDLRRAHLEGDWDQFSGQFFTEFRREKHTCEPFTIPSSWYRFRSLDYGMDMTACYWWAVDESGNCYIYRELYEPGLTLSAAAEAILGLSPPNEQIRHTVASPDLWNKRQETAISGMQIMANSSLLGLIPANNKRIEGWRVLREYLAKPGKLQIFTTCENLIRTLPQLQYDGHEGIEDASPFPHEVTHAAESIRYGVCSLPFGMNVTPKTITGFYTPGEQEDYLKPSSFKIRTIKS